MDKINVTISETVLSVLNNDACKYFPLKYLKKGRPNINGLLNSIIPSLLDIRKERRAKIENLIERKSALGLNSELFRKMLVDLEEIFDSVYFDDEEDYKTAGQLSVRPLNENLAVFDEIAMNEARIMDTSVSSCFRSMLNEYSRLPEYKRQQIIFYKSLKNFYFAVENQRLYCFRANGIKVEMIPLVSKALNGPVQDNIIAGILSDGKDTLAIFSINDIEAPYVLKDEKNESIKEIIKEADDFIECNLYNLKAEYKSEEWRSK
ncbi:MAG: hypothetical protein LKJ88_04390 [Bacilli bacterium]|jgi:hypothetical protein|nr:hypothetical protein [Bacilli bacterium]